MTSRSIALRPPQFDSPLETEYRTDRTPGAVAMARATSVFAAVLFLSLGFWDNLIDPGAWANTWPARTATAIGFIALLTIVAQPRSLHVVHVLQVAGFALAGIGMAAVAGQIDNGYIAGVPGFIVAMGAVSVGPVTHRAALAVLAAIGLTPVAVYAIQGATRVELWNLVLWLGSGAGFTYIGWRLTDDARRRIFLAERALAAERDKVDALVRKMVPNSIADRLKAGETNISDRHEDVTLLFADIVGFTRFSERRDPQEIVGLLNGLFGRFDSLVADHGLEKIKTMGDGYMVAGGAPAHRADHAAAVVALAVAMQESLADFRSDHALDWDLRIGIHSGPVVAGVIGSDRYAYDMWGDTVNVASRIESTGAGGEIHLSAATATRIDGAWQLEELGFIELKNREPVEAFRLIAALMTMFSRA